MKMQKIQHQVWNERAHEIVGHLIVGQWQYIYSSEKGQISLVQLYGYSPKTLSPSLNWKESCWEILCQKGGHFDDVMRFATKKEAERKIGKYLE